MSKRYDLIMMEKKKKYVSFSNLTEIQSEGWFQKENPKGS